MGMIRSVMSDDGLPVGFQFIAPQQRDEVMYKPGSGETFVAKAFPNAVGHGNGLAGFGIRNHDVGNLIAVACMCW